MSDNDVNKNMALWNSVCKTDPSHTKRFNRRGFNGTSISPLYLIQKVTAQFGPIGLDWGFDEVERFIQEGVWFSKVRLWIKRSLLREGEEGCIEIFQWGGTEFCGTRSTGKPFVDDEAGKKSITDGLLKCLTYLGFAADVHMGLHDDDKYVQGLLHEKAVHRAALAEKKNAQAEEPAPAEPEAPVEMGKEFFEAYGLPELDGVTYVGYGSGDGGKYIQAKGGTKAKKEFLKEAGFKWSTNLKGWFKPIQQMQ